MLRMSCVSTCRSGNEEIGPTIGWELRCWLQSPQSLSGGRDDCGTTIRKACSTFRWLDNLAGGVARSTQCCAFQAIVRHKPEAIVTLGGDCLVDLAPIAYLTERYGDDLAVLWADAHPDVMGPAQFQNAHAHVLAILMGEGDSDFASAVVRPLDHAAFCMSG